MPNSNTGAMALSPDRLNDVDQALLDLLTDLQDEECITPTPELARKYLADRGVEKSRQYINQRLVRLAEHEHVENIRASGVYRLISDPRE